MKSKINNILIIFIVVFSVNTISGQDSMEAQISKFEGDTLKIYNLLKKSINLSSIDSTKVHVFSALNIYQEDNYVCFKTYFYDANDENNYLTGSATNYAILKLNRLNFHTKEYNQKQAYEVDEKILEESIPKDYNFTVYFKKDVLTSVKSKEPILNNSNLYFIEASFYRKSFKNLVDYKVYNYLHKDSINNENYYYFCTKDYALLKIKGKYGFIDNENKTLLPFDKNKITYYNQGFLVEENRIQYFYDPKVNRKISKDYDKIIPNKFIIYDKNFLPIKRFSIAERNGFVNILDSLNNEMLSKNYKSINGLGLNKKNQFVLIVQDENNMYHLVDLYTQNVIRTSEHLQLAGSKIILKNNEKYGLINIENDIILDIKYDEIISHNESIQRIPIRYEDKWALYISLESKFVTDFIYTKMIVAGEFLIVKKNEKYGIINSEGKIMLPLEYDEINYDTKGDQYGKGIYKALKNKTQEEYNRLLKKTK